MSANRIAGLLTGLGAVLAWLVVIGAVAESTTVSMVVIVPLTLVFALLVGAVSHAIANRPTRGWSGIVGRAAVAVAVGAVVGELAAVVVFSGPVDRLLDERAARSAASTPAVEQASAELGATRQARTALDAAVEDASRQRDQALVVARCEYHPTADCPQTRITGVPGAGTETRTATDFLADTQRRLDAALADRDRLAPGLDAGIAARERALDQARSTAMKQADRGLGARWSAMNDHTSTDAGAMLLRVATDAFFVLLMLLPLILKLWRGQTSEVERAEQEADTAIAVKRAEVRAAVENLWAEQELASARLAVEAQMEIDREQQRRRVMEAVAEPAKELPAPTPAPAPESDNLPALVESQAKPESSLIPDVTKAAARWLRPFVPPIVATAIDTTTKPLRSALQVFEETEEIHFSLRRTHKITVQAEQASTEPEEHGELLEIDGPRQLPAAE